MNLSGPRAVQCQRACALIAWAWLATFAAQQAHGAPHRLRADTPATPDDVAQEAVAAHTRVRAQLGLPPLQWSPSLAAVARDWARQLCARARGGRVVLQHRPNNRYGENLYWQGNGEPPPVGTAVASWAEERRFFDANTGRCRGGECGHYTQLVWRSTRQVGCGAASCGASHFWVCNYDPPGNWVGQRPY